MVAHTDRIRSITDAVEAKVVLVGAIEGERRLVTTGRLASWRAAYARVELMEGGEEVMIDAAGADLLGVKAGDTVMHVGRG